MSSVHFNFKLFVSALLLDSISCFLLNHHEIHLQSYSWLGFIQPSKTRPFTSVHFPPPSVPTFPSTISACLCDRHFSSSLASHSPFGHWVCDTGAKKLFCSCCFCVHLAVLGAPGSAQKQLMADFDHSVPGHWSPVGACKQTPAVLSFRPTPFMCFVFTVCLLVTVSLNFCLKKSVFWLNFKGYFHWCWIYNLAWLFAQHL